MILPAKVGLRAASGLISEYITQEARRQRHNRYGNLIASSVADE